MADDGQGSGADETGGKAKGGGALGGLVQAESMLQMAMAVPAGCVVGLLIGSGLDHHFHTKWIVLVMMLLGAAGGFVQIFTLAKRGMGSGPKGGK